MKLRDKKKSDISEQGLYQVKIEMYEDYGRMSDKLYPFYRVSVYYSVTSDRILEKTKLATLRGCKHQAKKAVKQHKKKLIEDAKPKKEEKPKELVYYVN